jgi:hypothetical protein
LILAFFFFDTKTTSLWHYYMWDVSWIVVSVSIFHLWDWGCFLQCPIVWLQSRVNLMREGCFQFDSTKHLRFSLGIPVSSCSNTRATWDYPY